MQVEKGWNHNLSSLDRCAKQTFSQNNDKEGKKEASGHC